MSKPIHKATNLDDEQPARGLSKLRQGFSKSSAKEKAKKAKILSRIFIQPSGDIVITDLWDVLHESLAKKGGFR